MSNSVRRLHPLDLLSLAFFNGQANRAWTWEGLGRAERALSTWPLFFREQPLAQRHTLVWVRWGRIWGLLSARPRGGPLAWEVDRLFLAQSHEETLPELLEHLSLEAGRLKVEKIFLRLHVDSSLLGPCRASGFGSYRKEALYRFSGGVATSLPDLPLRPRSMEDDLALFQLSHAFASPAVRAAEALTLEEWRQAQEPKLGRELVYSEEGRVSGWVRLGEKGGVGQFYLLVMSEEKAGSLVDYCLGALARQPAIYSLAPEFHPGLARALEARGGDKVGECFSLVKTLAARVPQPQLVPIQA